MPKKGVPHRRWATGGEYLDPHDAFDAFLQAQRRRVAQTLRVQVRRIEKARTETRIGAHEVWVTRGRIAGYCGLRGPAMEE